MSRRKQGFLPEEDEPELDISSLIDVCFLLLIYFMVTATIQPRESDLGLSLPTGQSSAPSDLDPMLVAIQEDGSIVLNKEEQLDAGASLSNRRELPLLKERLSIYKSGAEAANATPLVQVEVKDESSQQSVIDVINCLKGVGIESVTFTDLSNE